MTTTFGPLYDELKQIVEDTKFENLLEALKKRARNTNVKKRGEFENALLTLAQKSTDNGIRPVLYETMVSLESIWNTYLPKEYLQGKFWTAIKEEDIESAVLNYKELAKQGLDFIGIFPKKMGKLIPIVAGEEYRLLQYSKEELMFYDLRLEPLPKNFVPESLKIIDVLASSPFQSMESTGLSETKETNTEIWILFEEKDGKNSILSMNTKEVDALNADQNLIKQRAIVFDKKKSPARHLSYYKNHLLIVSKNTVYYYEQHGTWEKWYTSEHEITAYESTGKGFWVGHSNGDVIILKELDRVGVRDTFKQYSNAVESIRESEGFVLISDKKCLCIADFAGNLILRLKETDSEIIQSVIPDNKHVLIHLANGMLIARELKQGNICRQINLGDIYDILFTCRQYVYCGKKSGEIKLFEIPLFTPMVKALESKNIYVDSQSVETEPDAPVRYISEFIGRRELLNEIKSTGNTHFLLYGEPGIGKTSLLNVLRDSLSESAKCCFIDLEKLLKTVDSYPEFEKHFMEKCLGQHFMSVSELPKSEGYQALRAMVKKIKGCRKFCVFCLDNFSAPGNFDEDDFDTFNTFLRSMLIHPEIRIIMACNSKRKTGVVNFFDNFKDILNQRKLLYRQIPLFSEMEVKNALRKKVSLNQDIVNETYRYTGRFPHLVHLFDKWDVNRNSIEKQSKIIAKEFTGKIFEYFRDLSSDAYLLLATCLRYGQLSEKSSYTTFYENFPLLKISLPRPLLDQALREIENYGDGVCAGSDGESFHLFLKDETQLLHSASGHLSWLTDFSTLYKFTSLPDFKQAHNVAQTFTRVTGSELDSNASLTKYMERYKKIFYVNKLTEYGRQVLDMPLSTFIVIPLQPWMAHSHKNIFKDLYVSIQEFERLSGKFYILFFEFHGIATETIKDDLIGLERISILDTSMMKRIIPDESPREKASDFIFNQLSIKERSPYTTSGAVPDELFYGREMEIQLIRGLPENIGIFGTRTIGKTSLLRRLNKDIKSQKKWKVYSMDCSRIESEELLLKNLAEKMGISFEAIPNMGEFRRYVTREAEISGKQYLFLLDEVDRLVQYDIENKEKIFNTFNRLCTEAMENDEYAARFILFGFQRMFEQMKNPGSRLYNFMVFLPLKPLDVTSALALVTQPIEKIRVRWKDKNDALYLVNSCSCHPRLLQAACHSLLTILDGKTEKKDIIEKFDVDQALTSDSFREMCMRFYQNPEVEKEDKVLKNKKSERKKSLFFSPRAKDKPSTRPEKPKKGNDYWNDLHRITILSAIRLLFEEGKESFNITGIQRELKKYRVSVSPNVMRIILDHLCLSGNFNLKNESTLIARQDSDVQKKIEPVDISAGEKRLTVDKPDIYSADARTFPKFIYEFGVKIFPKLLVANFGGIDQCKDELRKLIEKREWEEWLRRY